MTPEKRDAIRQRLADLEVGGCLTPARVVEDAASPDSPLHDQFEWDDDKAAAQYRVEQARALISSVRVVVTTETSRTVVPMYVRDPRVKANQQGYVSVPRLRSDKDAAREMLLAECLTVRSAAERMQGLAAAVNLESEAANLLGSVRTLHEKASQAVAA